MLDRWDDFHSGTGAPQVTVHVAQESPPDLLLMNVFIVRFGLHTPDKHRDVRRVRGSSRMRGRPWRQGSEDDGDD